MKNKAILLILFAMAAQLFGGWSGGSNKIINFYYYQNKPYYLNIVPNKLFIKTKEVLSESDFKNILGQFVLISQQSKFDINIKEQFVDLNANSDNSSIAELVTAIERNGQVDYASAVYAPSADSKVLQGVEDQVIAQFKRNVTSSQINDYLSNHGLSIVKQLDISGGTTYILKVSKSLNQPTIDAANAIYESGIVNFCDPDFYYSGLLSFIPNDTFFPMQWSLKNTGSNIPGGISGTPGCDMRVDSAWNTTLGTSHCIVGMVDTGIDTVHEDLAGNMLHGYNYDFINGHPGGTDDFNHGTCTAGIVAAVGNNGIGISGVCPNAKLIAIKIFNSSGSTTTTALTQGLTWSWNQGEWISSNSWGGGSPVSAADQTIQDGTTMGRGGKGTVFCFASGNGNGPVSWPATNAFVIAVGGNSPCNERKSPSSCDLENFWGANYGTGLNIVAPCVKVYATDRMGAPGYDPGNYFATFNGTSSATPNCAGVCALGLSRDSTMRWDTVRVRLCRTADKVGTYSYTSSGPFPVLGNTWNNEMGYGKINANRLLASLGPPPPPPAHDIAAGPFLSMPTVFLINTAYAIKSRFTNVGANNETGIPVKFFINGTLININNINLNVNQFDSVSNTWTPTTAGAYTLKYICSLASDLNRNNDTITTTVQVLNSLPPLCEQFEGATFPPANWSASGTWWKHGTVSGFGIGTGSAYYNMWNAPAGTDGHLITMTFAPTSAGNVLHIDMAYSPYPTTPPYVQDSLIIQASTDGGTTWVSVVRLGPLQMQTVPSSSAQFTPTANQWVKRNYPMPTGTNKIDFLGRSQFGNDLYIDSTCLDANLVGVTHNGNEIPKVYSLAQNYPNPFNPATNISFGLPKSGLVRLVVYDLLGRVVSTLVNEHRQAGTYSVSFDAANLSSGIYFYKIESGDFSSIKKMVLVK
jgi:hypothetical protein